MNSGDFSELEKRLGHRFGDAHLLERALTHSSLTGADETKRDLERLEFLGDRVLGLLTAETLWRRYPEFQEGDLAPRFNALVRKETCAKAARYFGVDQYILLSPWEEKSGGRKKKAILGDAMEALLGAIYIDGGLEAARQVFERFWTPNLEKLARRHRDAKTALQEWSQSKQLGAPDYDVVARDGPAHDPAFEIAVRVKGYKPARGRGRSKRAAQMEAAQSFLEREGVWET